MAHSDYIYRKLKLNKQQQKKICDDSPSGTDDSQNFQPSSELSNGIAFVRLSRETPQSKACRVSGRIAAGDFESKKYCAKEKRRFFIKSRT